MKKKKLKKNVLNYLTNKTLEKKNNLKPTEWFVGLGRFP